MEQNHSFEVYCEAGSQSSRTLIVGTRCSTKFVKTSTRNVKFSGDILVFSFWIRWYEVRVSLRQIYCTTIDLLSNRLSGENTRLSYAHASVYCNSHGINDTLSNIQYVSMPVNLNSAIFHMINTAHVDEHHQTFLCDTGITYAILIHAGNAFCNF